MKVINHFEQNRPMHLALRDIFYERAIELLKVSRNTGMQQLNAADYEEILFQLRSARNHGRFAVRDGGKNEKDEQFFKFINMLAGNVKAILSMLNLKRSVEAEDGFFFSFLEINRASVALQAEEYERRALDIIRSVHTTLDLASEAYAGLKEANRSAFSEFERERYDKAEAHYKTRAEQHPEQPQYQRGTTLFS
jgi:tetratricopeptide (TPR) repeat protein